MREAADVVERPELPWVSRQKHVYLRLMLAFVMRGAAPECDRRAGSRGVNSYVA